MITIYKNGYISTYAPWGGVVPDNVQKAGKTEKKYRLTWKHYRHIASSAVVMWENKVNKLTFWTFTFKEGSITYPEAVKVFSKFIDNWKKTYKCQSYIWVGELTEKGTPHFHMLADIKYVDIKKVNEAFCRARGYFSNSAVRLPQKLKNGKLVKDRSVVKNLGSVIRYLCKYLTKTIKDSEKVDFGGRVYAMSRGLSNNSRKYQTYEELYKCLEIIKESGQFDRFEAQYCTMYSPKVRFEEANKTIKKLINF